MVAAATILNDFNSTVKNKRNPLSVRRDLPLETRVFKVCIPLHTVCTDPFKTN